MPPPTFLNYLLPIITFVSAVVVAVMLLIPVVELLGLGDAFFAGLFGLWKNDNRTPRQAATRGCIPSQEMPGVPDYVVPIVAYRAWNWVPPQLASLNDQSSWYPDRPMMAKCPVGNLDFSLAATLARWKAGGRPPVRFPGHETPHERCTCGIYAAKTLDGLHAMGYARGTIFGEVYLWGRVVEHAHGWRAQFAYPKSLRVPLVLQDCLGSHMEALIAYGADVYLGDILLWTRQRGYTRRGRVLIRVIQLKRSLFDSKWFLPLFSPRWPNRLGSPTSVFYLTALAYLTARILL